MPKRHFLIDPEPLAKQVAGFIRESRFHPTGTLLITPTAGAARRINQSLKAQGSDPLDAAQPMQALLPQDDSIATPTERSVAWAKAIERASASDIQALFWKEQPQTVAEKLKAGRNFCGLCDLLAEGGLTPEGFELPQNTEGQFDQARWHAIARVYGHYLHSLELWRLKDPNELRLRQIEASPPQLKNLILAGVSDLPRAVEYFAHRLESNGAQIHVLIWNPASHPEEDFDLWGRPRAEIWNRRHLSINSDQIHLAASSGDEARLAVRRLSQHTAPAALVSADPNLQSAIASELLLHGRTPFLPEGDRLNKSEAAILAFEWENFRESTDLRTLRRLLEIPAFCRALDPEAPISVTDALTAIDHLLGKTIASTLESGWAASPAIEEDAGTPERRTRALIRRLLGTTRSCLSLTFIEILERAYPEDERPESAARVIEIGRNLERSPSLVDWIKKNDDRIPSPVFAQALRAELVRPTPSDNATTIHGWLEAPWLLEKELALCGIIEGRLPQSVDGDPFLPESARKDLKLSNNEQRLARDAYLLSSLLRSRDPGSIHLSLSKYNGEGDPNRPSRLLLRTEPKALANRVLELTQTPSASANRPKRKTAWRWSLPAEIAPITRISPTQFESYLSCPFRYCLERSLKLDTGPVAAREMDAAVFGNLIHETLENFGNHVIPMGNEMLKLDEQAIRAWTQKELEIVARKQFGPSPAPAVQVQIANASARLHGFASIQSTCFAEGWIILDVERKLEAEIENALRVGPLQLSGIIDRIEKHSETGALRVMDYKTFSSKKTPKESHFGPDSHNWLPAARVEIEGKRTQSKTWKNLQLPLYRKILEHWYPKETAEHRPNTAYFLLPSDPLETGIYTFDELNEPGIYKAAIECATTVADHIARGVFWPPQPHRKSWEDPFAALFTNGTPEECISSESIEKLKGMRP